MLTDRLDTTSTTTTTQDNTLVVSDTRFAKSNESHQWTDPLDEDQPAYTGRGAQTAALTALQSPELPSIGVTIGGTHYDADAARTERARHEQMDVALLEKGGRYEVHSHSGNTYHVDVLQGSCSCPDDHDCCKHQRRVDLELRANHIPRPDGRVPT